MTRLTGYARLALLLPRVCRFVRNIREWLLAAFAHPPRQRDPRLSATLNAPLSGQTTFALKFELLESSRIVKSRRPRKSGPRRRELLAALSSCLKCRGPGRDDIERSCGRLIRDLCV